MTKFKDSTNLGEVIGELSGKKPEIISENNATNYMMPMMERFYNMIRPALTTQQTTGVIFFNSTEDETDNAYPNQLMDYYHNASATFSNLINLKRNLLKGTGLQPELENDAATIEFLNTPNMHGETIIDIWDKLCFDYALFESFYLECLYSPKDKGLIKSVVHHSPDTVRAVANPNINLPYVDIWMLSRAWGRTDKRGMTPREMNVGIPVNNWNPYNWAADGGRQLLSCRRYSAGGEVYSIPSFNSILQYVELDAQLATFSLNTVSKGFTPTSIVVLNGNPDKKQKDEFTRKFKQRYTGADGEKVLFIWTTTEGEKPAIMPFNNDDITPMLEAMVKITTEKICSGMGATGELAGIQTGGQSLQSDYNKLAVAYSFYYKVHILPQQLEMIKTLNKIMKVNGLSDLKVVTPPLELDVPNNNNNTAKTVI